MKPFGVAGWSGSGKTTLVARLIPALVARGVSVSTIKHAHSGFDVDQPGKDSYEHRRAGAREVLVASSARYAIMHELRGAPEPGLAELLARLAPVDLVLVEGFKRERIDKLEVWRAANGTPPLWREDPRVVAVAGDVEPAGLDRPFLPLDDVEAIAAFVLRHCGLSTRAPARA
jgi:molybdopterin-guanine dinucleotide biosynthesis protein B